MISRLASMLGFPGRDRQAKPHGSAADSRARARHFELIRVHSRRVVDNLFAGDYISIYKGRGTEFLEVREYSPDQDDIREIDWNVTARAGTPHVKKFREEKDLAVMLLLDMSASMEYGSHDSKGEKVLELASLIGMSVVKRNNRIGFIAFTDRIEAFHRPKSGRKQLYRLLETVKNMRPKGKGTDISRALDLMNRLPGRGTVVFLISDFMSEGYESTLKIAARRFDLIPVVIEDPAEGELPDAGIVSFVDGESGEAVTVDCSDRNSRVHHAAEMKRRRASMKELFRSSGLDDVTIRTDRPVLQPVRELFARRERTRRAAVAGR